MLGNHDFYKGSIAGVRAKVAQLTKRASQLHWLSDSGVIELTVLCGHTHGQGEATILRNLVVKTGSAEYGHPRMQELIVAE